MLITINLQYIFLLLCFYSVKFQFQFPKQCTCLVAVDFVLSPSVTITMVGGWAVFRFEAISWNL